VNTRDTGGTEECIRTGAPEFPGRTPETGTVTDNADGSYSTGFYITRSGQYALKIDVSGTLGVGSPFILNIVTGKADKSQTYVYGKLQGIAAGFASELYVQTRDQYGNHIRADEDLYPLGQKDGGRDSIGFQVCKSVMDPKSGKIKCGGGEEYTAVGVNIRYSMGPDGKVKDPDGEPYHGLYQIMFFPFSESSVQPRVLHGDKAEEGQDEPEPIVVECYFDTTGKASTRSDMDPGDQAVNACLQRVALAKSAASRRGLRYDPHYLTVDIATNQHDTRVLENAVGFPADRRQALAPRDGPPLVTIERTFMPPDTSALQQWFCFSRLCAFSASIMRLPYHARARVADVSFLFLVAWFAVSQQVSTPINICPTNIYLAGSRWRQSWR